MHDPDFLKKLPYLIDSRLTSVNESFFHKLQLTYTPDGNSALRRQPYVFDTSKIAKRRQSGDRRYTKTRQAEIQAKSGLHLLGKCRSGYGPAPCGIDSRRWLAN